MGLITHGAVLQNEVKAWPPLVAIGAGLDLVTQNQWWDDEGTPTTKATAVPVSGEAGLDEKFEYAIKCVTDAADEGFNQRYTYADEPRIKSGATLSALVWVATTAGGSGITAKLRNSGGSSTSGVSVATDGDWTLLLIEAHVCSGTYVELVVTKDASGTFYAGGPITVSLGANAIALPPRGLRRVMPGLMDPSLIKTLTGLADEVTWTDIDCTAASHPLAAIAQVQAVMAEGTASTRFDLYTRRNGATGAVPAGASQVLIVSTVAPAAAVWEQILDDQQIFEYFFDRVSGATTLDFGTIMLLAWKEWE